MTGPDPFGTASIRERVLAAWAASPARLREDANAEEDLSLGGYRDRVVVELAQNAADAAVAAGEPGRLRLSLTSRADRSPDGAVLAAANTGRPLDADGVAALATLRASAKREQGSVAVGRFGVGFAAVLSVTDEPVLLSRGGAVRFSRADTAELVSELGVPGLTEEVRRRGGHVPALRLPFAAEGAPPEGFATVVLLPLRDAAAAELAHRLLGEVDDALLLALPGLARIEIELDGHVRALEGVAQRWHSLNRSGVLSADQRRELLADRPIEEAGRPAWSVLWALPRDGRATAAPQVLHAPTPTDEPMSWPALLIASFPLDPSRRHVAPGPLTDWLVGEAAAAYADLLSERAATGTDVLALVPAGLAAGALDGALRARVLEVLRDSPILLAAEDGTPLRPRDAIAVAGAAGGDPAVLAALAPHVGGLVAAPARGRTALRLLGVEDVGLADVLDSLPPAASPQGWAERYARLAPLADDADGREALGTLPVPLVDGRVVRGPRGLLLPGSELSVEALTGLVEAGVRVIHPQAAHPLLARLGAVPATARQLLDDAAVRELVETSPEAGDPDAVAGAVLALIGAAVAAGELEPGDLPWLGDLALPDAQDELSPASALALPGSIAAGLFDSAEIGIVADTLVGAWGAPALVAAGVLDGLAVLKAEDVDLVDPGEQLDALEGFASWAGALADEGSMSVAGELLAVRDLDAVRREAWPQAVRAMASAPTTRAALVRAVRVRDRGGRARDVPSYTAWWMRRELALGGTLDPAGDPALAAVLDPAPSWVGELDDEVRRALGVVRRLDDLDSLDGSAAGALGLVLDRLADPARPIEAAMLLRLWSWLAGLTGSAADVEPPSMVRALSGERLVPAVVPADQAVVVDAPMWLQRSDIGALVVAPAGLGDALADLLDLAVAAERSAGVVTGRATSEPVPDAVRHVVPGVGASWSRHSELKVDGVDVAWWVDGDGRARAVDEAALASALAWAGGAWSRRHLIAAVLTDPVTGERATLDAAFDPALD